MIALIFIALIERFVGNLLESMTSFEAEDLWNSNIQSSILTCGLSFLETL
jgi:hypothetical protein